MHCADPVPFWPARLGGPNKTISTHHFSVTKKERLKGGLKNKFWSGLALVAMFKIWRPTVGKFKLWMTGRGNRNWFSPSIDARARKHTGLLPIEIRIKISFSAKQSPVSKIAEAHDWELFVCKYSSRGYFFRTKMKTPFAIPDKKCRQVISLLVCLNLPQLRSWKEYRYETL